MRTNLKVLRVQNGLTQEQMATECAVGRCTYAAIENGERRGSTEFWSTLQERFGVADESMWGLMRIDTIKA